MLSKYAEELCHPEDEAKDISSHGRKELLVTYVSTTLTPFQDLLYAVVLSRPIAHTLSFDTILTLFNLPCELTAVRKIKKAGTVWS